MANTLVERPAAPSRRRAISPEEEIIRYISKFTTLSDLEVQGIIANINVRYYKKGAFLLREGQIASLCFFVLKGCVRQYYLVDGEEKTTNFYTEGQPITPYAGTFKREPSKYYLACVEDCILSAGTPEDEARLYQMFPRFEAVSRTALEEEMGKNADQLSNFILSSPEERYLHLLETRPDLLDRVPQYQLASFLGIKPESLSRIRKRIVKK